MLQTEKQVLALCEFNYNHLCFEIIINISSSHKDVLLIGKYKEEWQSGKAQLRVVPAL